MSDKQMLQTILDKISTLEERMVDGFRQVNSRLDSLGTQLNELDEDLPAKISA